ncbi:hypothetical protein BJ508DRAFT_46737 [Ascobolus immersus RN42]|uniref:Uncharacterized protein n=1 Tax=Ascobolus immersus RN42 TaxID=1160509 RepID=A0A3N4IH56_ASCIM|nr:hypothetical protein BJ508DRAFT_46737 [Ascobolus immersus RN42]
MARCSIANTAMVVPSPCSPPRTTPPNNIYPNSQNRRIDRTQALSSTHVTSQTMSTPSKPSSSGFRSKVKGIFKKKDKPQKLAIASNGGASVGSGKLAQLGSIKPSVDHVDLLSPSQSKLPSQTNVTPPKIDLTPSPMTTLNAAQDSNVKPPQQPSPSVDSNTDGNAGIVQLTAAIHSPGTVQRRVGHMEEEAMGACIRYCAEKVEG